MKILITKSFKLALKLLIKKYLVTSRLKGYPSLTSFIIILISTRKNNLDSLIGYRRYIKTRKIRVVSGWNKVHEISLEHSGETLNKYIKNASNVFYRGKKVPLNVSYDKLKTSTFSAKYPLEVICQYTNDSDDGNFGSIEDNIKKESFDFFRTDPQFHFLTSSHIDHSSFEHKILLKHYAWHSLGDKVSESLLGWSDDLKNKVKDQRHTTMTYIHMYFFQIINNNMSFDPSRDIVEIGGGYGGLARIFDNQAMSSFNFYHLIDLNFVGDLQKWFLENEASDFEKFRFWSAEAFPELSPPKKPQLLIATHSLSELSPELIIGYLDNLVESADNILLSMQLTFHINKADISWLLTRLLENYNIKHFDVTEGLNVVNIFMSAK